MGFVFTPCAASDLGVRLPGSDGWTRVADGLEGFRVEDLKKIAKFLNSKFGKRFHYSVCDLPCPSTTKASFLTSCNFSVRPTRALTLHAQKMNKSELMQRLGELIFVSSSQRCFTVPRFSHPTMNLVWFLLASIQRAQPAAGARRARAALTWRGRRPSTPSPRPCHTARSGVRRTHQHIERQTLPPPTTIRAPSSSGSQTTRRFPRMAPSLLPFRS